MPRWASASLLSGGRLSNYRLAATLALFRVRDFGGMWKMKSMQVFNAPYPACEFACDVVRAPPVLVVFNTIFFSHMNKSYER